MEASKTPSLSLLKVCKVKLREATDRAKRLTESVAVLRGSLILSMVQPRSNFMNSDIFAEIDVGAQCRLYGSP